MTVDENNIVIIDYGMGNLRSVHNKFKKLGVKSEVSSDHEIIKKASKLILPGVGNIGKGMKNLEEKRLINILNQKVLNEKTPIFGICLGMQIFTEYSEEGDCRGLGWIKGKTVRFQINDKLKFKIPHIGWNSVKFANKNSLDGPITDNDLFYFVHSYHVNCEDISDIWMTSRYEYEFVSAIRKNNIYGTQFHPEKSHDAGMLLLKQFTEL